MILLPLKNYSQDFNLFNPGNELYLFSAYDEGANAFRYNPAVLGLGHRLNVTLNAFIQNYDNKISLNEIDFLASSGILGLAFRTTLLPNYPYLYNNTSNNYSLGLGFGNKSFSIGAMYEHITFSKLSKPDYFDLSKTRNRAVIGMLYRPGDFLSTSFVFSSHKSLTEFDNLNVNFMTGIAVRPLRNDRITLMLDFSFSPFINYAVFENNTLKLGAVVKAAPGVYINANFTKLNLAWVKNEYLNIGLRFDLNNFSLRYNNPLYKANYTYRGFDPVINLDVFRENPDAVYKSQGNQISLTYSLEKRKTIVPEKKKIIEITLSGSLQDYNTEDVFFGILGKGKRSVHEVIADIDYAAADPSVRGMLLKIYPLATGRFEVNAAIEELTNSLERFKSKGKTITAFFPQDAGPGEYYIATFANDIVLPPESIFFYGLSIDVMNYRQFLQKYGIELQTFHAGKYKLTFQGLLDSTTEEGKEVINRILDVVYEKMMGRVVTGRNITLDDYMREKLSQPLTGTEALRLGLVDKNGWYEDAKEIAEKNSKTSNIVKSITRSQWDNEWGEPDAIAIVGVYASITTGESQPPSPVTLPIPFIGGGRSTGSETVVRQLEDAFGNPKVKVIILRVDSGGGSALGSAEINSAIIRLKKKYKKPFYVSMGSAAASGGYYVSTSADKIFADETTITGSIGVFTARPNLDSLLNEQKIKVETFKRGENSDIGTFYRKLDEKEIEIIQGIIDFYYDRFIAAIVEGRNISKEEAEEVAQGRVWLGTDAFNKKLVDELGGLYETISYAKKKSKLGNRYKLIYYSVPGGNTINDIVTSSVLKYMQASVVNLLGFEEDDDGLEIKY
jgi:protease IV